MLQQLMLMYTSYMIHGTTGVIPHLIGPPGTNKSAVAQQLAEVFGVKLRVINVSRINPLEVEGMELPDTSADAETQRLVHLLSSRWDDLQDGDIIQFDEFLRGFPEVYNGLLDVITSRKILDKTLPKVFIMAASNNFVAYDEALEDRLVHIPVQNPAKDAVFLKESLERFVEETGMMPSLAGSSELEQVFQEYVIPMYDMLDLFKNPNAAGTARKITGNNATKQTLYSARNLKSQIQLGTFEHNAKASTLKTCVKENNTVAHGAMLNQHVIPYFSSPLMSNADYVDWVHEVTDEQIADFSDACQRNVKLAREILSLKEATKAAAQAAKPNKEEEAP